MILKKQNCGLEKGFLNLIIEKNSGQYRRLQRLYGILCGKMKDRLWNFNVIAWLNPYTHLLQVNLLCPSNEITKASWVGENNLEKKKKKDFPEVSPCLNAHINQSLLDVSLHGRFPSSLPYKIAVNLGDMSMHSHSQKKRCILYCQHDVYIAKAII